MNMVFLKIKIKSLAEEARIIRKEERKTRVPLRDDLHIHRVVHVRAESRNASLAYAYLRGRRYRQIEAFAYTVPSTDQISRMVKKYGGVVFDKTWLDESVDLTLKRDRKVA